MTYRNGAYVMDIREDRIAQVIGRAGAMVQVRTPGGGLQWEVPASALRLATREEREAAGLRPYLSGCAKCVELETARQKAGPGERPRATAAARTHWIVEHSASEARR
ncbi:hypothetical protein J1792_20315 [Streptomyces triculaminicus]|uniref:Uncharacterized protein n=2 Tax=Streptomyces TaxID=1883 RepID=A0A939FPJ0_9ACTN|nr:MULTISPECIES: hypothetical protein [Streptomyces]MBO0655037.1 hypothetical protein [Streptomyces triculaminicus]QSY51088.1 hypothetical protein J3S04_09395 [Streptomyces griseocarneus]